MPDSCRAGVILAFVVLLAPPLHAQQGGGASRPSPAVELTAGYAAFVDDGAIEHAVFGGAARFYLTPRLSVGPELTWMRGPGSDRDLFLTGNLTFDVLGPREGRPRRVTPFVVGGGGLFRHTQTFGTSDFSHVEGAFTGGGGVRVWLTDRVYAGGEVRLGWEPHLRFTGIVGVKVGGGP